MSEYAMEPLVRNAWYIAAWAGEIDAAIVARRILGEDVVLFRDGTGKAAALEDRCCHRGVPLSLGATTGAGIRCGYHGLVFDGAGACVDNPGEAVRPEVFKVRAFKLVERQHFLWIWMGDQARADEDLIIEFPYHDLDEWPFQYGRYGIAANYMFMIDNLMDLTHLGYVHGSTIGGDPEAHNAAEIETRRTETGAHFIRGMMNSPPPPSFIKAAGFKGNVDRWSDFEFLAPSSVRQWGGGLDAGTGGRQNRDQEGGLSLRLFHHATPESDGSFHYFFSVAAKGVAADLAPGKAFFNDILEAFLEDKEYIEAQQAAAAKDPDRPLILRQHDKAVAYSRQALHQMADADLQAAAE
jgi:phenylpropionate dioxygenase-like ring-hydroxylating dioxygenase large terminal subunit